jgi:hypothetical protein
MSTSSSPERSPRRAKARAQARGQLPALLAALLVAAAALAAAALWVTRRRRAQYLLDFYAFSPPQRCVPGLQRCRAQAARHMAGRLALQSCRGARARG